MTKLHYTGLEGFALKRAVGLLAILFVGACSSSAVFHPVDTGTTYPATVTRCVQLPQVETNLPAKIDDHLDRTVGRVSIERRHRDRVARFCAENGGTHFARLTEVDVRAIPITTPENEDDVLVFRIYRMQPR